TAIADCFFLEYRAAGRARRHSVRSDRHHRPARIGQRAGRATRAAHLARRCRAPRRGVAWCARSTRPLDRWRNHMTMTMRFTMAVLAYLVPTFALGFVWHLVLFERYYDALAIYRHDIIIPFGFLSMLIQAVIFAWIYEQIFVPQ